MKERPILYSTPMVQAKLAGLKTQTRRIIKESFNGCLTNGGPHPCPNDPVVIYPGEVYESPCHPAEIITVDSPEVRAVFHCSTLDSVAKCPYGKPGDILWGRETYMFETVGDHTSIVYKADFPDYPMGSSHWKPSIFMRKEYARIWERIKSIRVERLQEINASDKWRDCVAEGILSRPYDEKDPSIGSIFYDYLRKKYDCLLPQTSYRTLWESINGPGSWELNPWVWVIETEVLSTTGRPSNL